MLGRLAKFLFGVVAYLVFFASLVYFMGWTAGIGVAVPLDAPATINTWQAIVIDGGLLVLFGIQHSVMARPAFKAWWTQIVTPALERSVYVLVSSVALFAVMLCWQPLGGEIWSATSQAGRVAIHVLYGLGWVVLFVSTFLINHFDLFGLRQVWLELVGRPYTKLRFGTPLLYRIVRHPLYVGWLLIFWSAPTMTVAHLLMAVGFTTYILIAIRIEERDLMVEHPEYAAYRQQVPMLLPRWGR